MQSVPCYHGGNQEGGTFEAFGGTGRGTSIPVSGYTVAGQEDGIGSIPAQNMWNGRTTPESPLPPAQLPTGGMNNQAPVSNPSFHRHSGVPAPMYNDPSRNASHTCDCQPPSQTCHHTRAPFHAQPSNIGPTPIQNPRVGFQPQGRPPIIPTQTYNGQRSSTGHSQNPYIEHESSTTCAQCKREREIPQSTQSSQHQGTIYLNGKWFNLSSADKYIPPSLPSTPAETGAWQRQQPAHSAPSTQPVSAHVPHVPPVQPTTVPVVNAAPISQPGIPRMPGVSAKKPSNPVNATSGSFILPGGRPPGGMPPPPGWVPRPPGWQFPRQPTGKKHKKVNRSPTSSTTAYDTSGSSNSETSESETSDPETSGLEAEETSQYNPFDHSDSESSDSGDDSSSSSDSDTSSKQFPTRSQSTWPNPAKHILPKLGDDIPECYRSASPTAEEWERQKRDLGARNNALDRLMSMVGMEEVKAEFLRVKTMIETTRRRKGRLRWQDLNLVLMGNPGTGKRTLAGLYLDFLSQCGVWSDAQSGNVPFKYISAINIDFNDLGFRLSDIMYLFIDAIDNLDEDDHPKLLDLLDRHAYKLVVVISGSSKSMTRFLGSSSHGRWQFGRKLQLKDLMDEDLRLILFRLIQHNSLKIVGGDDSSAPLMAAKRVGKGRMSKNFGNVYELISAFEKMLERHSSRLDEEKRKARIKEMEDLKNRRSLLSIFSEERPRYADRSLLLVNLLVLFLFVLLSNGGSDPKGSTKALVDGEVKGDVIQIIEEDGKANPGGKGQTPHIKQTNGGKRKATSSKLGRKKKKDAESKSGLEETIEAPEKLNQDDDISWLTPEDILGNQPADFQSRSDAWKELESMTGLEDVKRAIKNLADITMENHYRQIDGKDLLQVSLNRVFLGPPGTGKTTVAKLYGQILADIGLLSTNEVIIKTPSDFIGQYIGDSEANTNAILESSKGKVLIIDDAYTFYHDTGSGAHHDTDEYKMSCIDTLVSNIQNTPGEDRCVILVGYRDLMESMFQKVNPGLRRRFPLEDAFYFQDYDDKQLNDILRLKMAKEEVRAEKPAMDVAAEVLRRIRDRPNFGNGGDVQNLLDQAKARFHERTSKEKAGLDSGAQTTNTFSARKEHNSVRSQMHDIVLEREDFDPEWNRGAWASQKCASLFNGLVGFDPIISQLQDYQRMATNMRLMGKDPRESIPFTFVFKGPPGTGKTHTARIMGQIFYDMGFLSTNEVVECSASNLIGEYLGQTGPKVVNLLDRALGKVLFIDEAYRLGGETRAIRGGGYEKEAVGELVDSMTKPRYLRKLVIVLAGYDGHMNTFMKANPGLRGRFPTDLSFRPMSPHYCEEHLINLIHTEGIFIHGYPEASGESRKTVLRLLEMLSMTPGWSNARDVKTLASMIITDVYKRDLGIEPGFNSQSQAQNMLGITTSDLIACLDRLFRQRNIESREWEAY